MKLSASLDTSYTTTQSDIFKSGLVSEIGPNALTIWLAIKNYADYGTGRAFPGMRRLAVDVGMSPSTVKRAVDVLVNHHLLRIVAQYDKKRGQTYIARERLNVRIGKVFICSVILDYVPDNLRKRLSSMSNALSRNAYTFDDPEVEIIWSDGFRFDSSTKSLKITLAIEEVVASKKDDDAYLKSKAQIDAMFKKKEAA